VGGVGRGRTFGLACLGWPVGEGGQVRSREGRKVILLTI
jgi:hypothetical protein